MQNNMHNRWLRYLIYLLVIAAYVTIFAVLYFNVLINKQLSSIHNNIAQSAILTASYVFGIILGAEHLIHEFNKKKTTWQFNVPRFVLIGIPALLASLTGPFGPLFDNVTFYNLLLGFPYLNEIGAVVFGYIFISNFTRKKVSVNKEMTKA